MSSSWKDYVRDRFMSPVREQMKKLNRHRHRHQQHFQHPVVEYVKQGFHKIGIESSDSAELPHLIFIGFALLLRLLFPPLIKWLVYKTYATTILSVWFPLIYTFGWIHQDRYPSTADKSDKKNSKRVEDGQEDDSKENNFIEKADTTTGGSSARRSKSPPSNSSSSVRQRRNWKQQPSYLRKTASQMAREAETPSSPSSSKRRTKSKGDTSSPLSTRVFNRTSPKAIKNKENHSSSIRSNNNDSSISQGSIQSSSLSKVQQQESGTKYWLQYWIFYSLIQAIGVVCKMTPYIKHIVAEQPILLSATKEFKFFFFIWIFGMEILLSSCNNKDANHQKQLCEQVLPLQLLHKHITPILLEFHSIISEAVSKEKWTTIVHSKVKRVLELFVTVRLLSEPNKDWLLHIVAEFRVLALPCLTLFMPSVITQFGVAYVQFVIPSAKSAILVNTPTLKSIINDTESDRALYLQYWVLHCFLSGFLNSLDFIIWWIPFSTHVIFIAWCHLSLPQTIANYYPILEMELVAFGLLKGEKKLNIHETRTVKLMSSVIPRASDIIDEEEKQKSKQKSPKEKLKDEDGDENDEKLQLNFAFWEQELLSSADDDNTANNEDGKKGDRDEKKNTTNVSRRRRNGSDLPPPSSLFSPIQVKTKNKEDKQTDDETGISVGKDRGSSNNTLPTCDESCSSASTSSSSMAGRNKSSSNRALRGKSHDDQLDRAKKHASGISVSVVNC